MNDNEWNTKLWCAKNFGWKPEEVDQMPYEYIQKLIHAWNREQQKAKMEQRRSNKNKR